MEERAIFTFFRSFYEAAQMLPSKEDQADFLMSVCGYALDGVAPNIQGVPAALFLLVKPNIDASRKKAASGAVGGSRKPTSDKHEENKPEANSKQTASKDEANSEQTAREEGIGKKEEGNRKYEEGSMDVGGEPPKPPRAKKSKKTQEEPKVQFAEHVFMTNDEYQKLLDTHGEADTARLIEILDNYKGSNGKRYESDYRAILSWCRDRLAEQKAKEAKRGIVGKADRRAPADGKEAYLKEFERNQRMLERMRSENG